MLYTILLILLLILLFNSGYLFIFSAAGALYKSKPIDKQTNNKFKKIVVIIPGYKEDNVIIGAAESVLDQYYPADKFECVVLADKFLNTTVEQLIQMGAKVFLVPDDEFRNKAKSIQLYLDSNSQDFDACVILDADNCVDQDMLIKANQYLQSGVNIIQGCRVAKNEDNKMSQLDSISEIINNHIFRKGQRALNFSASLIGSGMIIEMNLFRQLMNNMNVISGFDKELELRILKSKLTIEYAEKIKIYDEKVSMHSVYVNQRRRWTYAQIYFLKRNFFNAFSELILNRNFDYFNKIIQFALLPRIICLGFICILPFVTLFVSTPLFILSILNLTLLFISFILALKGTFKPSELIKLVGEIPSVFIGMLKAILTSGKASKKFIHTPHNIN